MSAAVKTSVISHPPEMPMAIVRAEYKMITLGDDCAALLLNAFEHMHNRWGKGWIRRTHAELSEDILWQYEGKTIGKALKQLEAWGLIETKESTGINKTKYYRLNIPAVQEAINLAAQLWQPPPEREKVRSNGKSSAPEGKSSPPNGKSSVSTYKEKAALEKDKAAAAFDRYMSNIGMVTPIIADDIKDALQEYGEQWVLDAITEAAHANGHSWNYCLKILQRWQREGRNAPPPQTAPSPGSAPPPPPDEPQRFRWDGENLIPDPDGNYLANGQTIRPKDWKSTIFQKKEEVTNEQSAAV